MTTEEFDAMMIGLGPDGFMVILVLFLLVFIAMRAVTPRPERESDNPDIEYPMVSFFNKIGDFFNSIAIIGIVALIVLVVLKNGI